MPPQNNGCAPSFFKRALHELILLWFLFIFMCVHSFVLYLVFLQMMSARALLDSECSSPQKDGCSSPPKIMGARPHFFKRAFHELISFLCIVSIHLFSIWLFFEWWVLVPSWNNGCSSPQKDGCSRPLKIMGAPLIFSKEHFRNFISFMSILHLFTCSLLSCLWIMSARALLNNGCSSPLKIMGARAPKKMGARAP